MNSERTLLDAVLVNEADCRPRSALANKVGIVVVNRQAPSMTQVAQTRKFEVPSVSDLRGRMRGCDLIGRQLGSMYAVPDDPHDAIEMLLRELDRKTAQ